MKAKQSQDSGVEDGMGEERETPTQRKRENRRQCERGTGPPYRHPGSSPPRCCQCPPGLCGYGVGDQASAPYKAPY